MTYLLHFLTPFATALVVTILLIPVWISICKKWQLFDEPDNRKHHSGSTPSMGGITIFAGLFISFLIFAEITDHEKIRYLFGSTLILFFTGFFDDLMDVPPGKKMFFQAISSCIIFYGGFQIYNLDGILGITEIPGSLQLPLTLLVVMAFTNGYNFIDGIDGLAASLGIVATTCLGAIFIDYGKLDFAILSFCITGALLGFLFYNFNPAKIFMGDTGSLVVGFMIAVLSIELLNTGIAAGEIKINPSFVVAIVFIPLFDICRVIVIRFINGKSLLMADRNHIHHGLLHHGFGHKSASMIMVGYMIFFILLQQLMKHLPVTLYLVTSIILALIFTHHKIIGLKAAVYHRLARNTRESSRVKIN